MSNININDIDMNTAITADEDECRMVRHRPTIYFGGFSDARACVNGTFELITNGVDEIRQGFGDRITVKITPGKEITVTDNGRGVPMDWNPKAKAWNWHLVYNKLSGSGKGKDGIYKAAAGLNGVGAAITQFASHFMDVTSIRDEKVYDSHGKDTGRTERYLYKMHFEEGYPAGELQKQRISEEGTATGTKITYMPDERVFDTNITFELFDERCRALAAVTKELKICLDYCGVEKEYCFEEGIKNYILSEVNLEENKLDEVFYLDTSTEMTDVIKGASTTFPIWLEIAVVQSFNTEFNEPVTFHNGIVTPDGGTSTLGTAEGLAAAFTIFGRKIKKLDDKSAIDAKDLEFMCKFVVATSFNGDYSIWDGQDKKAIKNKPLREICCQEVMEQFEVWSIKHTKEATKLVNAAIAAHTARKKMEDVKKSSLKKLTQKVDGLVSSPSRLTDCVGKDASVNEIYIVEGKSAGGSAKLARNSQTQAVFELSGKILNCLKATVPAIIRNGVISEFVQSLGCGLELNDKLIQGLPRFDESKLRYSKIILMTDADVDGAHIQCEGIVCLYRLMPTLIRKGMVYVAQAPLFLIETPDGYSNVYAYSDTERDNAVKALQANNIKYTISRFKGLGEMDAELMAETVMNPDTRRLIRLVLPEDERQFIETINIFMGDRLSERKSILINKFNLTEEEASSIIDDLDAVDEAALDEDEYEEQELDAEEETDF